MPASLDLLPQELRQHLVVPEVRLSERPEVAPQALAPLAQHLAAQAWLLALLPGPGLAGRAVLEVLVVHRDLARQEVRVQPHKVAEALWGGVCDKIVGLVN